MEGNYLDVTQNLRGLIVLNRLLVPIETRRGSSSIGRESFYLVDYGKAIN
jgi:hypothetical protein